MKSEDYWAKRMEHLNEAQLHKGEAYAKRMKAEYEQAMARIQRDTEAWYARLAKNNNVSLAGARQLLKANELKEFKWDVKEYIKAGKENAIDQQWLKELENASAKVHINKLQAQQIQMRQHIESLTASKQAGAHGLLGGIYKDNYYKSIFELQKGIGLGSSFAKLDKRQLEILLSKPWAPDGKNFSTRIWSNRNKLLHEMNTALVQGLIRGVPSDKVISEFAKRMNVSRSDAERLIITESAFFSGHSRREAYKELDVEECKNVATLDKKTSTICRHMDGTIFLLSEAKPGVNCAPFHARCRTVDVPHFEGNVKERAARGEDGKTYNVPGDMNYPEWAKKHAPEAPKPYEDVPVVPNTSTIFPNHDIMEPISYKEFTNPSELKNWESKVTPKWLDDLTVGETKAISSYTGSKYYDINKNLRNSGADEYLHGVANKISNGLAKFNLPENIVAYRGVAEYFFPVPIDQLKGHIFTDKAFASTSLLKSQSFGGLIKFEIRVPASSRGAYINPLSNFKDSEYEFLLDKGTMFEVLEVVEQAGKTIIVLEVLGNGDN